ncbi:hypothetical protein [Streptomyces chilikensis]|uniref:Uncharacterized protein n=1 Tax=Streptomyces chilikensis TaxID=1194079 RepID=A0ABV3EJD7_9ACTN
MARERTATIRALLVIAADLLITTNPLADFSNRDRITLVTQLTRGAAPYDGMLLTKLPTVQAGMGRAEYGRLLRRVVDHDVRRERAGFVNAAQARRDGVR